MASEAAPGGHDQTLTTYERFVDRYIERSSGTPSPSVQVLLRELAQGARVLELGSGPGWDAVALEEAGLQVVRTDAAHAFC